MNATKQVFISYRRDHDDALAGRIRDRMRDSMPDWSVFLDVNSIRAGVDFRKAIDEQLASSSVFLPLIGKRWLDEIDARLQGEDHVRYEIKSALDRQGNLKIIPVLVNDAVMPGRHALPEDIAALASLNAARIGREDMAAFAWCVRPCWSFRPHTPARESHQRHKGSSSCHVMFSNLVVNSHVRAPWPWPQAQRSA